MANRSTAAAWSTNPQFSFRTGPFSKGGAAEYHWKSPDSRSHTPL